MSKIVVAMSGGVDSGAAALLLLREGYDVTGVTFDMLGVGDSAGAGAAAICTALGIPHATESAVREFDAFVRRPFGEVYEAGGTPNPCVVCNRDVKFPKLIRAADRVGAELAATGHYARITRVGDSHFIRTAADLSKDQSYMLWALEEETVSRLLFPLGEYTKSEIREITAAAGLPCHSSPDSQDICFIPDGDHRAYLDRTIGAAPFGDFIDGEGRVLGRHIGQRNFTVGQSRGLGIALGRRMYVTERCAVANTVRLGDDSELYKKTVRADGIRLRVPLERETRLLVRVRYTRDFAAATVVRSGEDEITAVFDDAVRAPAPGQSMVLYDGDTVVGGGFIV